MFSKLAYLPSNLRFSRANICFKNVKFPRGNYQPILSSSTETLDRLNSARLRIMPGSIVHITETFSVKNRA